MASLTNTDLAFVSTGAVPHFYFQKENKIIECAYWDNVWGRNAVLVAEDADPNGSPIAAYYVEEDFDHDNKVTIHVLYLRPTDVKGEREVVERVKYLKEQTWHTVLTRVPKATETSTICAGSFNGSSDWKPKGAQWAYYITQEGNKYQVTEISRTKKGSWNARTVSPSTRLLFDGTSLACSVTDGTINLYLQSHEQSILWWTNSDGKWEDKGALKGAEKVQAKTPIAAAFYDHKRRVIYVDDKQPSSMQLNSEGTVSEIAQFYNGTRLGAVVHGGNLLLLYKGLYYHINDILKKEYNGSTWSDEEVVVADK